MMGKNNLTDQNTSKLNSSSSIDGAVTVFFKSSGITASWSDEYESILEFAEAQGLEPDFSCRAGICNTCHCGLIEGEVEYIDEPLVEPDTGHVLPCISIPRTSIVIEL